MAGPQVAHEDGPSVLLDGKFYGVITLLLIMSLYYDVMQVKITSLSLKHMR